jgi:hypothetical protein
MICKQLEDEPKTVSVNRVRAGGEKAGRLRRVRNPGLG